MSIDGGVGSGESAYDVSDWVRKHRIEHMDTRMLRGHESAQALFCKWIVNRWEPCPAVWREFERAFHVKLSGDAVYDVERICDQYRHRHIKLERNVRRFFRKNFGARV